MMPIKTAVRVTAVAVGLIYALALLGSGIKLDTWLKQLLGLLPTLAVAAIVAFDLWVWRWPFVHRFLSRPLLLGTWKVSLTPHPDSHIPNGGNWGPIDAYLIIEQTFWTLSATLHTAESTSRSRAARFVARSESKAQLLTFMYENVSRREHRERSPRHIGACEISIESRDPDRLAGEYFTDRFTAGEMQIKFCDRSTGHTDFAAALEHCR